MKAGRTSVNAARRDRANRRASGNRWWVWPLLAVVLLIYLAGFTRMPLAPVLILPVVIPFAAATLVSDLRSGMSEPLAKLPLGPYRRAHEPRAYWASVSWNAALLAVTVICVVAAAFGAITI